MSTIITRSSRETYAFANDVVSSLNGKNVLALSGDLGSGKTTFSQGIGKALGITNRMISPTFVIIKKYDLSKLSHQSQFKILYHIDLYRIEKSEEVIDLGILDFTQDPTNLVVIEWAEKMEQYLPEKRIDITFEYVDEDKRRIIRN